MIKATQRVAIPPGTKALRIERARGSWCVWIHANPTFTLGTYLELHDTGLMEGVTVRDDDTEERWLIKPED